jgi:hypothetical protein
MMMILLQQDGQYYRRSHHLKLYSRIVYNFDAIADAAWLEVQATRDRIDPKTCPHTCIAKNAGYEKHRVTFKEYPPVPRTEGILELAMNAGIYDIEIYRPDICYVCRLEMN